MIKFYSTILLLLILTASANAQQDYVQYFDGADTLPQNSLFVTFDPLTGNIWQIGMPQKNIFDSAATVPNAIVTDTINSYPVNNLSTFIIKSPVWMAWGLLALQWKQKLDLEYNHDLGVVKYSMDHGNTWMNAMNNPYVYNFYGYDQANKDTLPSGDVGFSGTDSTWRDVWLCLDMVSAGATDTIYFQFTLVSDSSDTHQEGWMIDNMFSHISIMHPVKEENKKDYMNVYPNPSKDIVHIEMQKIQDFHIIEHMELYDPSGREVKTWKNLPTMFWFDVSKYPDGIYHLSVTTNLKSEIIPIVILKN